MSRQNKKIALSAFLFLVFGWGTAVPASAQGYADETGFIQIDPVNYFFHMGSYYARLDLVSFPARLWYSFQAADADDGSAPLFVFFNGGPGSATSCGLMSMNTGRWTMEMDGLEPGSRFIPNPHSWTALGHLLFIDARQTGFSYSLMDHPENRDDRLLEFNVQNHNTYFDAADFIRALLSFFDTHPGLRMRRVVLVPESYGGVRATIMLHLLLHYRRLADGSLAYQDPALADRLQDHYEIMFPEYKDHQYVPPELIARQFSHQIMIQPAIVLDYQDYFACAEFEKTGSVLFRLAEETGTVYTPVGSSGSRLNNAYIFVGEVAGRDVYGYHRRVDYLDDGFIRAGALLENTANLSLVTGCDISEIPEMHASARDKAYRVVDENEQTETGLLTPPLSEPGSTQILRAKAAVRERFPAAAPPADLIADFADVFGILKPWDRYMMSSNRSAMLAVINHYAVMIGYDVGWDSSSYGDLFFDNLTYVKTFITNAKYDLRIYTPVLAKALVQSVWGVGWEYDEEAYSPELRPGRLVFTRYNWTSAENTTGRQVVRFPLYSQSGHAVPYYEPAAILEDVTAWLRETGVPASRGTNAAPSSRRDADR